MTIQPPTQRVQATVAQSRTGDRPQSQRQQPEGPQRRRSAAASTPRSLEEHLGNIVDCYL